MRSIGARTWVRVAKGKPVLYQMRMLVGCCVKNESKIEEKKNITTGVSHPFLLLPCLPLALFFPMVVQKKEGREQLNERDRHNRMSKGCIFISACWIVGHSRCKFSPLRDKV